MLAITQFEVYVLDHGRWTIHARYGSHQRKAAVMDARTTEFTTGLPTKVVCETYFPEINESELVTAYVSPKARELREEAKTRRQGRSPGPPTSQPRAANNRKRAPRQHLNVRQYVMRVVVAGAFSLVAATLTTLLLSWVLRRVSESGVEMTQATMTNIVTYGYAVLFVFYFMSLFRSRLPLHKLLAYLWQQNTQTTTAKTSDARTIAAQIAPRLRPKNSSAAAAAADRALEELKTLRGDPTPEPVVDPDFLPARPPLTIEQAPIEIVDERTQKKRQKELEKAQKAAADKVAAEKAAAEKAAAQATALDIATPSDTLVLERAVLRRFIADVIVPATTGTMPDDPVTRRGIALVLSGASAALAETAKTDATAQIDLLIDALKQTGFNAATLQMFMEQYEEVVSAPANISLVDVGRAALAKHLDGVDVARMLAVALAGWRTPHGQPTGMEAPPGDVGVAHEPTHTEIHDVYFLSELRIGSAFAMTSDGTPDSAAEAARDAAMGLHNSVVRNVLGTHSGHEVKHTGMGIFARFASADAAIAAATEVQRRFTASYGPKLAIALIANTNSEDPLVSSNIVRQAQTAAAQALDGETLVERRLQRAAGHGEAPEPGLEAAGDGAALVKLRTEPEPEESLYEHSPAIIAPVPAGPFG